ncbi:MAG: hypothetical protein H6R18_667 [Proteobacteria bacterium]|nr:hypothetical protein [Pseudomonadota bacterium]
MLKKFGLLAVLLASINVVHAADNYGAIAFNSGTYAYGFAYDHKTQADANQRALSECGRGCKVVLELMNECGAIYRNNSRYAWSNGRSRQAAENGARNQCGSNCKLVAWSCTTR